MVLELIELYNVGRVWLMQFLGYCEANVLSEYLKVNQLIKKLLIRNRNNIVRELIFLLMR